MDLAGGIPWSHGRSDRATCSAEAYPITEASQHQVISDKLVFFRTLRMLSSGTDGSCYSPQLTGVDIDAWQLYRVVCGMGGYKQVTRNNSWRQVCSILRLPATVISKPSLLRKYYFRVLQDYEQVYMHQRGMYSVNTSPEQGNSRNSCSSPSMPYAAKPLQHSHARPTFITPDLCADAAAADGSGSADCSTTLWQEAPGVAPAAPTSSFLADVDADMDEGMLISFDVGGHTMHGMLYNNPAPDGSAAPEPGSTTDPATDDSLVHTVSWQPLLSGPNDYTGTALLCPAHAAASGSVLLAPAAASPPSEGSRQHLQPEFSTLEPPHGLQDDSQQQQQQAAGAVKWLDLSRPLASSSGTLHATHSSPPPVPQPDQQQQQQQELQCWPLLQAIPAILPEQLLAQEEQQQQQQQQQGGLLPCHDAATELLVPMAPFAAALDPAAAEATAAATIPGLPMLLHASSDASTWATGTGTSALSMAGNGTPPVLLLQTSPPPDQTFASGVTAAAAAAAAAAPFLTVPDTGALSALFGTQQQPFAVSAALEPQQQQQPLPPPALTGLIPTTTITVPQTCTATAATTAPGMSLREQVLAAINAPPLQPPSPVASTRRGPPISLSQLHAIASVQASLQSALVKGLSQRLNSSNIAARAFHIFRQDARTVHLQLRPAASEPELQEMAAQMWHATAMEDRREYMQEALEQLYGELKTSAASIAEEAGRSVRRGVLPALLAGSGAGGSPSGAASEQGTAGCLGAQDAPRCE